MAETSYVVLEKHVVGEGGDAWEGWVEVGTFVAHNPKGAIAAYVKVNEREGGEFAACPQRSWATIEVETTTQTRLVFK